MAKKSRIKPTYGLVKLHLEDVEDALFRFKGIIPLAASYLGVEEHELYAYIRQDHALEAAWQDARRLLAAKAEGVLQSLLDNPDDRIRLRASEVVLRNINDEKKQSVTQVNVMSNGETKVQINEILGI